MYSISGSTELKRGGSLYVGRPCQLVTPSACSHSGPENLYSRDILYFAGCIPVPSTRYIPARFLLHPSQTSTRPFHCISVVPSIAGSFWSEKFTSASRTCCCLGGFSTLFFLSLPIENEASSIVTPHSRHVHLVSSRWTAHWQSEGSTSVWSA